MKFPGFKLYECWADALLLPEDSAAWGAARHMYVNCFDGVRIMSKFEEYEKHPELYQRNTIDKANRARSIGLKVHLCLDWHNTAGSMAGYHAYRYIPRNMEEQVALIIRDVDPDIVQIANEPYHIQKPHKKLKTEDYAELVYRCVRGVKQTNFRGFIVCEQSRDDNGDLRKAWEWHIDKPENGGWTQCLNGKHRYPRVLHSNATAKGVLDELEGNPWASRNRPVGYKWPIYQDEFSSCGRSIHSNSKEGAKAIRVSLDFFRRKKTPLAWLTMGGTSPNYGGEGGWGMHTQLVNSKGEVSLSGQEMLRFFGKPQYEGPTDPPPVGKVDMLELIAPSSGQFAKTRSEGGMHTLIRYDEDRTFVIVKGAPGKAWDWFYWDDEFIYHVITTDVPKDDATAFKSHVAPGVVWCRRFATLGESHTSSPVIHRWADCVKGPAHSLSAAKTTLHDRTYTAGELGMASSDVPGSTVCYRLDWRWGPNIEQLETFTYATGWGFLDWDCHGHDVAPYNKRSPKPPAQPDFPCFNVPDWIDENMRPSEPPPDGEVPPGGWHTVRTPHAAYMKMNNQEVVDSLAKINAGGPGGNHMITRECAVEAQDVPTVKAQLEAIVKEM